jgi:glutamine amidotransferase
MLVVVDYGLGNMRSICGALEYIGVNYCCTSDRSVVSDASGLILPGVGAFPDGMENLRKLGLVDVLDQLVLSKGIPVLGICLGFQLMAREGHEFKKETGLGWLDARVTRLKSPGDEVRVPHVGWNDCFYVKDSPLFSGIHEGSLFYFTHSYHIECFDQSDVSGVSFHGGQFTAAAQRSNVFGTQFHPEKSQLHGIALLRNFCTIVNARC